MITAALELPATIAPGKTFMAGVRLTVIPEWHTYWPGQNDSGMPTAFTWTLPKGFTAGASISYPAPVRHLGGGDVLDYVLENTFTVYVPITVDPSVQPGSHKLNVDVQALVCKDSCVPQSCSAAGDTQVKEGAPEPKTDLSKLPKRSDWQRHVSAVWADSGSSTALVVKPIAGQAPKHLEFFPYEESATLLEPIASGVSDTGELKLAFKTQGPFKPGDKPKPVYGVVRIGTGPTALAYEIRLDVPPDPAAPVKPAANNSSLHVPPAR